jgi:inhibitor of KinA
MLIRPLGEAALLVEFGTAIDPAIHAQVVALDAALAERPPSWLHETVPAYASLMLLFDPLAVDAATVEQHLRSLALAGAELAGAEHVVPVRYDGPDLPAVAARLGIGEAEVGAQHQAGAYRVYMYGFAPGYAYLGGVPEPLHLPRKEAPVRGHPPGSVMIAGGQCLVTTLPMPTGWWVIGHTDFRVLDAEAAQPFRLAPGDRVRFVAAP